MTTTQTQIELPASVLVKHQNKKYGPVIYHEGKDTFRIVAEVRHDDECGNGHNSFSITGTIDEKCGHNSYRDYACGCIHEDIAKRFPELAPFIKWHLMGTDAPMHYVANTVYHASDRDYNGLLKGEFRQHVSRGKQNNGVEGVPNWVLELPEREARDVYAVNKPAPVTLEWKAYGRTGEGKARDLDAARHCAVWPEATDEELTAPGLESRLMARLPALMRAFKADVEKLGLIY